MALMHAAFLSTRTLIALKGTDAASFLQGLVTCDMRRLGPSQSVYGALLTPQGKFLHDFFIIQWADGRVVLDTPAAGAELLCKRLAMYRLRANIEILRLPADAYGVAAVFGNETATYAAGFTQAPGDALSVMADPRLQSLGLRIAGKADAVRQWVSSQGHPVVAEEDYETHRLRLGVPDGEKDLIAEKSLPMEFGFEALHAIDFDKGCYVGQEVTARSKFRAELRRGIYRVESAAGQDLPSYGTLVLAGGQQAGELRSVTGGIGLAYLRKEFVGPTQALVAEGVEIRASVPSWLDG